MQEIRVFPATADTLQTWGVSFGGDEDWVVVTPVDPFGDLTDEAERIAESLAVCSWARFRDVAGHAVFGTCHA